ncbi:putative alpha/beta superfamily hydrolase [Archangium gephyra]|uniref:Alpha/beta superfamily hydrolase n=1 Tax=Archangium gephyra TaxID=48 RepID=A0AAC8Q108_9BACT|nr:alpha/beta hydrolase-fold protein [Archangium gephyra]AKI98885.1 putative esterase [Archangium gephyra]REG30802.1 putative alpha/beta superfamily hydrolase [Archangium gephyra]
MTHRQPTRLPLLLLLTLTALTGCPKPPPTPEQTHSEIQFDVTVPPETPVNATLLLTGEDSAFKGPTGQGLELVFQGGTTFSAKTRVPKNQPLTYTVQMTTPSAQVALDTAGSVVPARTLEAHQNEENVSFSVERWGPAGGDTQPRTAFVVAVPETTPGTDDIYLAGNHELLGGWNPAGVKLYKAVNNSYATVLSFTPDTSLEFKVTRGSWDKVEKTAEGAEVANHSHKTGTGFSRVSLSVGAWADFITLPPEQVLTGKIEYLSVTPTNTLLKKRDVIVWLPPDYGDDPERRYPVLYMHDGQNLMDATTAFAGEWGVDETAQELVEAGKVDALIIVGIYNTSDRGPEYTQVPDARYPEVDGANGGRADAYGQFIVNELKPMIDGKYRTRPEAKYTGLAGSSLGGLVTMYLGMKHPDTFSRLAVISPSVFWGNNDIVTKVNALPGKLALRIWVDIGTEEGSSSQETVDDTRLLRDALVNKGWVLGGDLKYTEVEGGKHNEAAWAARFGSVLQYLFPPPPP